MMPRKLDIQSDTLTITQLAQKLGLSRAHVSRNYRKWGFQTIPNMRLPRVLVADADAYLAGKLKPTTIFSTPSEHLLKHGEPEGGWPT